MVVSESTFRLKREGWESSGGNLAGDDEWKATRHHPN